MLQAVPTDEGVLNTLAYTFKACRAEKDLARCYENALSVQPNKDTFMIDLFFCYLRLNEPKKMQRMAQQLYKLKGTPMYVFWVVNSMLQQEDLPPAILTVAERMIEKVLFEGVGSACVPGAEELELYVNLLLKRNKVEEALSKFDILTARQVGQSITDDQTFQASGSLVKMHSLQKSNLRVKLLRELLLAEECSISLFITGKDALSSDVYSKKGVLYSSELISELYKILKAYPDQWEAHVMLIKQILGFYFLPSSLPSSSQCLPTQSSLNTILSSVSTSSSSSTLISRTSILETMKNNIAVAVSSHRKYLQNVQREKPYLRGPYLAEMLLLVASTRELEMLSVKEGRERVEREIEESRRGEKKEGEKASLRRDIHDSGYLDIDEFCIPKGIFSGLLPVYWDITPETGEESEVEVVTPIAEDLKEILTGIKSAVIDGKIEIKIEEEVVRRESIVEHLCAMLDKYIGLFQYKQCCFSDIKSMLGLISRSFIDGMDRTDCLAVRAMRELRDRVYVQLRVMEEKAYLLGSAASKVPEVVKGERDSNDVLVKDIRSKIEGGSHEKEDEMKFSSSASMGSAVAQLEIEKETEVEVEVKGEVGEGSSSTAAKKNKNKKKKNKNKNAAQGSLESSSSSTGAAAVVVSLTDSPSLKLKKAEDEVRARAVTTLCSCSKLGQIGQYCDFLLENFDSQMASRKTIRSDSNIDSKNHKSNEATSELESEIRIGVESAKIMSETAYLKNLEKLFHSTKTLCLGGVGGDREVSGQIDIIV